MARRYGPLDIIAHAFGTAAYFSGRHSYGTTQRTSVRPPRLGGGAGRIGWRGVKRSFKQGRTGLMPTTRLLGGRGKKSRGSELQVGNLWSASFGRTFYKQMLTPDVGDYSGASNIARFMGMRRGTRSTRTAARRYIMGGKTPQGRATRMARLVKRTEAGVARYHRLNPSRTYNTQGYGTTPFHYTPRFKPHDIQTNVRKHIAPKVRKQQAKTTASQFSRKRTKQAKMQKTGPVQVKAHTRRSNKGKSVRVKSFQRRRRSRR